MAKEWIEKLAAEIKSKDHGAAEKLAKEEHHNRVLTTKSLEFWHQTLAALQEDCRQFNDLSAGDVTSSPLTTGTQTLGASVVTFGIQKPRFPSLSATLNYQGNVQKLRFRYGVSKEVIRDMNLLAMRDVAFTFRLNEHEGLSLHEDFGAEPRSFEHPSEFAKYILETLLKP